MNNLNTIRGEAIVLSGGILESSSAKTTHGLLRGTSRFELKAIIDSRFAGKMSGEVVPKSTINVPIYDSVKAFIAAGGKAQFCIIGVATKGGILPDPLKTEVADAIRNRINIVNGLHKFLNDDQDMSLIADDLGVVLHDIRKPRPKEALKFWTGDIYKVKTPKIVVMGTDCGLGKRTTAQFIVESLKEKGHSAEMIFTGQTGWLQGWRYGFILDSTVNDFVSGELEDALLRCVGEADPDFIVIEGQAALRNISGPCGAELLISGNVDGVILHHSPIRKYYHGYDHLGVEIPPLEKEVELVNAYDKKVLGITLNTIGIRPDEARRYRDNYERTLGIPVALPMEEHLDPIMPAIENLKNKRP